MRKLPIGQDQFSTSQAAEVLGISRISVFKRIKNGVMVAHKVGRNYIISRDSLEAALGSKLTDSQKAEIDSTVKKAVRDYRETFERLAKE